MLGLSQDTDVRSDSVVQASTAGTLLAGGSGSPVLDRSSVFVFQLPQFGAVATPFTSAVFKFHLASKNGTPKNADLYGLGRRASATVLASDYYGQTTTPDGSDATLVQGDLLTAITGNGIVSTGSTATALTQYLNTQYAGGAGAGQYVFLRLSTDAAPGGTNRYNLTSADGGAVDGTDTRPQILYNVPTGYTRPFIWVRAGEKADILAKIANNPWAASVFNSMVSRVAADVASHQSNRDAFLRTLPVVDWAAATPVFKTMPTYPESTVRYAAEAKFNDAQDCAVLYYLTGDAKYARCAADILHNAIKTLLPVAASTSTGNGGWIFQNDLLKEARVTGPQLAIVYDFLYPWLQSNQVYDVKTASMVNFSFTNAQSCFRRYYQLVRDHGQKESNWSALMATTMLNNLLALDDATERSTAIQVYLNTGTSRQASLDYDYRNYQESGNIWPESLQYSGEVGDVRTTHMILLERVDPGLALFDKYPNLPRSLPRISYLRYPNGEQVSFGDGHRSAEGQPFSSYELVYQHAKQRQRDDFQSFFGSLINGGIAAGQYNRSTLRSYSSLSMRDEPLQLLWQAESLAEPSVTPAMPRTDTLPFAGIALQRNPAPSNNSTYGLMCFVGGAGHVHSHATGMGMELFGLGQVMGAKSGRDEYGTAIHENHYRLFAANNTVIVNGASQGDGGWSDIEINKVQTVSMEPQPFANAVSPDFSFTCSSFADDKGTLAEATQQRTMAIVRTSPTSGYYVDLFRSKSTVTNRTATTLDGPVTNQYHDYVYRNIGENTVDLRADGVTLPLTSQPSRFQNDIGDVYQQPGWTYFNNTQVSYPTSQSIKARFVANVSGTSRYMDLHMPAVASREYARVESPSIVEAPSPYDTRVAPTLVVRQIGEAWNKAFTAVYEPHFGSDGGTIRNVTPLLRSGTVVGVKVESRVGSRNLVQYIFSNPDSAETYADAAANLSFKGRFGIASNNGDGTVTLYLGEGSMIAYQGNSVSTVSGTNSQAEAKFTPGQPAIVTANTAVTTVVAPPPPSTSWIPSAGGSYDWNLAGNWNPAGVPNAVGTIAIQNNDLAGNQTIHLNSATTLGEAVLGDSSGSQTTTLRNGGAGSLVFDQTDSSIAYLTRTVGGTGTVTLASDLGVTLMDDLTVRLASGTAAIRIDGGISGTGKGITVDGTGLSLALSGANSFSGETRITAGILNLENSLALQNSIIDTTGTASGSATNGFRTTLSSLTFGGLSGNKNTASVFSTASGGYGSLAQITLNPGYGLSPSYSGVIANGAAGMTLTKSGQGTQTLTGANTYSGATILSANAGPLVIGDAGTLGSGAYAGALAIGSGSVFDFASSSAQQMNGAISGGGQLRKSVSTSNLTLGAANTSFTGSIDLSKGTLVLAHANAISAATSLGMATGTSLKTSVQNATVNAATSVTGSVTIHAPDFGTGSTVSTLSLNGVISGSGGIVFSSESTVASNSNQTLRLNAANTYSGSTTLNPSTNNSNLIVKSGVANALPATTVLSLTGVAGGGTGRTTDFDLNGFNQTIAGLQNTPASLRNQRVLNSPGSTATLTIQNPATRSFSGTISGTNLSLVKSGSGTQSLSGSNSYTGTTLIQQGRLQGVVGGNCANSAVTLSAASATIGASITDNTKTWTCKSLATTAAGTIEFDFGTLAPGTVSPLTVTQLADFSTSPVVRIVIESSPPVGSHPLMTWGSMAGTPPTSVTVVKSNGSAGLGDGMIASLAVVGNTLQLVIAGNPSIVKANNTNNLNLGTSWVGGVAPAPTSTARWNNTVTTSNTCALGAAAVWGGIAIENPGGPVTITNAGAFPLTIGSNAMDIGMSAATNNLTLQCPLVLNDENVWSVAQDRTVAISGAISGGFPIIKQGPGTALLSGVNSFTGGLSVSEGILEIGGSGSLGSGSYNGTLDVSPDAVFRHNSSVSQTLAGTISGGGAISKNGSGSLTLSGDNSAFTGPIEVNAGTLSLSHLGALGGATLLTIAGGATVSSQTTGIATSTPFLLGATGSTSTIAFGRNASAAGGITFSGPITGAGNLTFTTPNNNSANNIQTILLGAANIYQGSTLITTGNVGNTLSVKAAVANALPATTVLTLDGGDGSGSGRTVSFDLNGLDQVIAGLANVSGRSLRNQRILNSGSQPATLTIQNSSDFSFSGNINGTSLNLDKSGAGTQTLAGTNAYTGITSVSNGILVLANSLAMQNSALETSASVAGDAANGLRSTVSSLTLGGLIGEKDLSSVFTTTNGGYSGVTSITLNVASSGTCEYSGIISDGSPGMSLTKSGSGIQVLAGSNTWSGSTTLSAGILKLGASGVIPDGSGKGNVSVVGTLDLSGHDELINGLGGTGIIDNSMPNSSSTVTVGGNNQSGAFSGVLSNSGFSSMLDLIKIGTGSQALSGPNSHSGLTSVNAGALNLQHAQALGSTGLGSEVNGNGTGGASNARIELQGGILIDGEAVTLKGIGNFTGALTSTSGGNEWSGPVTIGAAITRIGASSGATLKVSGVIDSGEDPYGLIVRTSDLTGVVILSGANTYRGDTSVMIGKLRLDGGDDRLPVTGRLTMGSGTFSAEVDINGCNQEIAGLAINSGATASNNSINNSSSTPSTLAVQTASPSTFAGILKGNLSLNKTGPETLALTGNNSYSGDTQVMQGTLSQGTANLGNDASSVIIAGAGATYHLAFTGSDTVQKLFIGTTQLPAGTYGAIGSPVPVIGLSQITGPGTLTVTTGSPLSGYPAWTVIHAPAGSPADDFDGDGVPNGVEYILGGSSTVNDLPKLPTIASENGQAVFTFIRDQASIDGSTIVSIETSQSLDVWPDSFPVPETAVANNPGLSVLKNAPSAGKDTVTLALPFTAGGRVFARLKVVP